MVVEGEVAAAEVVGWAGKVSVVAVARAEAVEVVAEAEGEVGEVEEGAEGSEIVTSIADAYVSFVLYSLLSVFRHSSYSQRCRPFFRRNRNQHLTKVVR